MSELSLVRVLRPEPELLSTLAAWDEAAFGPTGLRSVDLAVAAEVGAVYMARLDGETIGGCQLLRMLDQPSFLYLLGFYVLPERRGEGLGRRFLALLEEECRRLGAEGLLLTVSPENREANALYRTAGFVEEALVPGFYGKGQDRLILRHRFNLGGSGGACGAVYDRSPSRGDEEP